MEENTLRLPIPLARLDGTSFPIDQNSSVMVDVGLSFNAPNAVGYARRNPHGFVLGFEPNPLAYFTYFAAADYAENKFLLSNMSVSSLKERLHRRRRARKLSGLFRSTEEYLPKSFRERFLVFPVAITLRDFEEVELFVSEHAGSSSLLSRWPGVEAGKRSIPALGMRLDWFLRRIPREIEWITHLKVDAEGSDLNVLMSAGTELTRCAAISVESHECADYLKSHGFQFLYSNHAVNTYLNSRWKTGLHGLDLEVRI